MKKQRNSIKRVLLSFSQGSIFLTSRTTIFLSGYLIMPTLVTADIQRLHFRRPFRRNSPWIHPESSMGPPEAPKAETLERDSRKGRIRKWREWQRRNESRTTTGGNSPRTDEEGIEKENREAIERRLPRPRIQIQGEKRHQEKILKSTKRFQNSLCFSALFLLNLLKIENSERNFVDFFPPFR